MRDLSKLVMIFVILGVVMFSFMALLNAFTGISLLPALSKSIGVFGSVMLIGGTLGFMLVLYGIYKSINKSWN